MQEQLEKFMLTTIRRTTRAVPPTASFAPVAGTAMDFRSFKPIGKRRGQRRVVCVKLFRGYDVNFCLTEVSRRSRRSLIKAASSCA